jgi:hypothetical protein
MPPSMYWIPTAAPSLGNCTVWGGKRRTTVRCHVIVGVPLWFHCILKYKTSFQNLLCDVNVAIVVFAQKDTHHTFGGIFGHPVVMVHAVQQDEWVHHRGLNR